MGKGDDFAGVGVPVKRGRGRPKNKNPEWGNWAKTVRSMVAVYGTADAYLADGRVVVHAAECGRRLIPRGAVPVGRYQAPFLAAAFYADMERIERGEPHPAPVAAPRGDVDFPGRERVISKIRSHLSVVLRPLDVYVVRPNACRELQVITRAAPLYRAATRVPSAAEFVGRYTIPFCARDFCDDLAAHLSTVPTQVAA